MIIKKENKNSLKLAKLGLPQISSFESLFISGDKSFLVTLRERDTASTVPKTYPLSKNSLLVKKPKIVNKLIPTKY